VLQTTVDLLSAEKAYNVHVVADGVSSCNAFEISIALDRIRQEGGVVGTSDSISYELMKDAALPDFKAFSKVIKETLENTKVAGQVLAFSSLPPSMKSGL
jgi:hypothetical protein